MTASPAPQHAMCMAICSNKHQGVFYASMSSSCRAFCRAGAAALQEGALTALASVADAANAHFIRYYDTVMPMLKNILYSASSKAEQLLRAKALECVSLVGMAVGKERFRADAQEVMAFMQQLQVSMPCRVSSTCPQHVLNKSL